MGPQFHSVLLLLLISGLSGAGEIARFKPVTATRADLANHPQVTVSDLTRGSGISSVGGAAGVWASRNWAAGSSPGADDYIEFVVTVDQGAIDFESAWYTLGRSSGAGIQGPQEWQLQYSLDGFTSGEFKILKNII